jgi:hypothetical protein
MIGEIWKERQLVVPQNMCRLVQKFFKVSPQFGIVERPLQRWRNNKLLDHFQFVPSLQDFRDGAFSPSMREISKLFPKLFTQNVGSFF